MHQIAVSLVSRFLGAKDSVKIRFGSFDRAFRSFTRWMSERKILYSDALDFVQFSSANTGVRARADLVTGDLIATIPKTACLTSLTCDMADIIEERGLGPKMGLAVALMHEKSRGELSKWYPYLSTLPDREDVPFVWPREDVDRFLKGTEIYEVYEFIMPAFCMIIRHMDDVNCF